METSLSAAGLPVAAVGMEVARDELMELIRETPEDQRREQLKVVSLVGFGGIGKTLLARQAYDGAAESEYQARAWVRAGERGAVHVIKEILRKLEKDSSTITIGAGSTGSYCHLGKLRTSLRKYLGTKRYVD
jgi:phosphoribosyl-AMP cyclohydrolase